ncbi:hypothetical protein [Salibaculum halophilum]|uniref:hypothetical protein n=1 Tax=Salibaculum halophilum TaxID=1914408 RepID=UPI00117AB358|nr:hypothetical protein [Salibaculum halophilum]
MTEQEHLIEHLRDEERAAAANAIGKRIEAIESLPEGPLRARLCATAHMTGATEMMVTLEGNASTVRQLRRLADMIEAKDHRAN